MRVAFLTNFIPPYRIGLYESLAREAGELRVFISTPMESNRDWTPDWGSLDVVQQKTLTLRRKWKTDTFSEDYELHVPYDTLKQLRAYEPDVILTGEMGARSVQAVAYARLTRTPVVLWAMLSEHTEQSRGGLRTPVRRWLARSVDAIIVNGESGARYFHKLGVNDEKLLRINQSLTMTQFLAISPLRPFGPSLQLLYVGSLSERKGVDVLLRGVAAWATVHPRDSIRLTLVGDGPLGEDLRRRTLPANVEVQWVGSVPYEELPKWFGQADVLLFPSLGDEWGLVVNEAFASGVPVVGSTYAQAVEELVRDGENGWVFTPDSPDAVAAALQRVLETDPARLAAMRSAARETIEDITPENAAARIVAKLRAL